MLPAGYRRSVGDDIAPLYVRHRGWLVPTTLALDRHEALFQACDASSAHLACTAASRISACSVPRGTATCPTSVHRVDRREGAIPVDREKHRSLLNVA